MKQTTKAISLLALGHCLTLTGCDSEAEPPAPVSMEDLGLHGQSYDDVVPVEFQSTIERGQPYTPRENDGEAGPTAGATIFSSPDASIFPIPRETRKFANKAEMVEFVAQTFGADELIYDDDGELDGARGSYVAIGSSYFEDAQIGARFKVTEPVLAFMGGSRGTIEVGGEELCLDPDGDCSSERASYLEPVGEFTAPTHDPECASHINVCVEFHSFYNRTSFPFPWARHGSNVRFTSNSAISSTRLSTGGQIHVPPGFPFDPLFFTSFNMPNESNQGQDSVESAVWCFGTTDCVEYRATAVCGLGTITDPDLNRTRRTGNGPANNTVCPG